MPADAAAAVAIVRSATALRPAIAIVAGSGLGGLDAAVTDAVRLPYARLPGWPVGRVAGHAGELVLGRLAGVDIALLRGRAHLYEGYSAAEVTFGVRCARALGARTLVVTNAAGGLNPDYAPGDVMVLRDHIFWPGRPGASPLRGPNDAAVGPRFPSMLRAYTPELREPARRALRAAGLATHEGVYAMVAGPSFETPAEARLLRLAGADAVGMSTCPEVVVAAHAGMRVVGLSAITNRVPLAEPEAAPGADPHEEVLATGRRVADRMAAALADLVGAIGA
ncbi:MAG: purine-nucleoside phosphorylase [Anaerolineae bacterium]